jgi:hypothetical protein
MSGGAGVVRVVVMIVLAAVYGVVQLAALSWWTRSVRFGVLLAAVAAGLWGCAPATVAVQWAWTRAWSAATGASLTDVTSVASYTVDPWLEEAFKRR